MAKLYITEYPGLAFDTRDRAMSVGRVWDTGDYEQTPVAIGAEAKSAAFSDDTYLIRVHCDAICSIKIAPVATLTASPATTDNKRLAAGQTEFFMVKPGWKLSVISNT